MRYEDGKEEKLLESAKHEHSACECIVDTYPILFSDLNFPTSALALHHRRSIDAFVGRRHG
jgi:hypothetical protein